MTTIDGLDAVILLGAIISSSFHRYPPKLIVYYSIQDIIIFQMTNHLHPAFDVTFMHFFS